LYRKLAKELLRSLSTQNAISNAEQMLESILNDVLFEDVALPTSARELIFKLMSNYLSNMNSLAIKSTIRGGAFVYNPSHNIVTVYDNAAGQVMTREDILYEINKLYKKKDTELDDFHSALKEELLKAENENEEINLYLQFASFKFNKTNPDVRDLNISDNIKVTDEEGNVVFEGVISQPHSKNWLGENTVGMEDVKNIFLNPSNKYNVVILNNKGRDLRPFKYTWVDA
jgi:hypothetical protein